MLRVIESNFKKLIETTRSFNKSGNTVILLTIIISKYSKIKNYWAAFFIYYKDWNI